MRTKHLPIAQPCHEDWDVMDRVERGRFCQVCVKQVYDLSSMTEDEAQELLRVEQGARICVRYRHDDEGRIRFRTPTPVVAETCTAPPRRLAWAGAAVVAVALAACTPHERPAVPRQTTVTHVDEAYEMGKIEGIDVVPHAPDPAPVVERQLKGEIQAIEPPPEPEPVHELLGDVAVEPMPVHERKGDVIAEPPPEAGSEPETEMAVLGWAPARVGTDEPCDGTKPGK